MIGSEIRILSLRNFRYLLNSYQLRTCCTVPGSLAAKAKKTLARGGLCEPTYGSAVRSLMTSASNVASLTSYAA